LDQEIPEDLPGTVLDLVAEGLGQEADAFNNFNQVSRELSENPQDSVLVEKLDSLQEELDRTGGWALEHKVSGIIDRVGLRGEELFNELSGGNKSRALLARALVAEPHLLLLDEPTNHLDVPGIRWLEDFFRKGDLAVLFVSHDRAFIRAVANRILDLDRGRLTSWTCDYDAHLQRKAAVIDAEFKQNAVFDKKLAEEEIWIRKGIQARRTRNEGRVRALFKMREERSSRREQQGLAQLDANGGQLSGRKVITVHKLTYAWQDAPLVKDLTTTIWRGDKIGIVGLNGSGKTTLLHLLLKRLEPVSGTVKHGTKIEVAYFDQHRAQFDENLTVAENVSPHGDIVQVNGSNRHILSYLKDFLFTPEAARAPIHKLSGGERARLLLARLFLQPANLLVLDEPTNDLDVETIELLEERLLAFDGTLLLVSHDRAFLNNVVTATYALDGSGKVTEYAGGCDQWLADYEARAVARRNPAKPSPASSAHKTGSAPSESTEPRPRKLLNKEREALKTLPVLIETLEAERDALAATLNSPDYYRDSANDPTRDTAHLADLETRILEAYQQWENLDSFAAIQ
ncbi:MAG: ATP-binding cassette domain-containing protein, partial [Opitutales bacterium]